MSEKNSGTEMPPVKAEGKETESTAGKKKMSKAQLFILFIHDFRITVVIEINR